jgi:hypothetical protein
MIFAAVTVGLDAAGDLNAEPAVTTPIDFTVASASYPGVSYARTGGLAYGMTSANAVASYAAGVPLWENRGNGFGGGLTLFAGFTNEIATPFDFATAPWAVTADTTVTPGIQLGPDGVTLTPRILSTLPSNSTGVINYVQGVAENRRHSVWARNDATTPPTATGVFNVGNASAVGLNFQSTTTWIRYSYYEIATQLYTTIWPAGASTDGVTLTFNAAASGAINAFGCQDVANRVSDLPLVVGTSGDSKAPTDPARLFQANGDFDVTLELSTLYDTSQYSGNGTPVGPMPNGCIFSQQTTTGLLACHYIAATAQFSATVNGAVVATTPVWGSGSTSVGFEPGDSLTVRVVCKASTAQGGIVLAVNGSSGDPVLFVPPVAALVPTGLFYPGSNLGATEQWDVQIAKMTPAVAANPFARPAQILITSDSSMSSLDGCYQTTSFMLSIAEARAGKTIATIANAGDNIADQRAKFATSIFNGDANLIAVLIRLSVNNIIAGELAPAIAAELSSYAAFIKAGIPGCLVFIGKLVPCFGALSGPQQAVWSALDALGVAGIANTDGYFVTGSNALNNGSNAYLPQYNLGDNLHENNPGRIVLGQGDRADLIAHGITP